MNKFKGTNVRKNYQDTKPTHFFNDMPTPYHQSWRDAFKMVRSKTELDRLKEKCCENCLFKKIGTCGTRICKFENDYILYRDIIDDLRKPQVVYVEGKKPDTIIQTRKYAIKPKAQCKQILLIQISKMEKSMGETEELKFVKALTEKENFKRVKIHAKRYGFDKLIETVDKYINGKLGTTNSENK